MNCTIHRCEQRTPEWAALRLGRACASRADDVLAISDPPPLTPTGKPSKAKARELAARKNYRTELVLERIIKRPQERGFVTQAMQDGIDREPAALALYQAMTGTLIESVGFIAHNDLMAGCSPDGIVGEIEGGVEAKSPLAATHFEYLRTDRIPSEYYKQIVHSLWITGASWWDWLSFHPEFPEALQIKLTRVWRSAVDIDAHDRAVRAFLVEVDRECEVLQTMADLGGQLKAAVA